MYAYRKCPEVRLIMVGTGGLLKNCMKIAEAAGIDHAVEFPGILSQSEIAALMQNSRAFVQHSITANSGDAEGTPLSVLEASASGLPILATRHGGINECVLDGKSGFLCAEKDIVEMGKNIVEIARNPQLAAELGSAAREHVKRYYSMKKSISKLAKTIHAAIAMRN